MEYDNRNSGIVSINDFKKAPNHPDFTGKGNYEGLEFKLALWERTDKNGRTFYSIKFQEPSKKQQDAPQQPNQAITETEDPLPF